MIATDFRKVTVKNGIGIYDAMSKMHGNETYPESRRTYSRPFSVFQVRHEDYPYAAFRNAMLEIGEAFIGDPFNFSLDADHRTGWFSPPFWNPRAVLKFAATEHFKALMTTKPQDVQDAYAALVTELQRYQADQAADKQPSYNTDLLRKVFEPIWQNDWMIDPRLSVAEKIFFGYPHSLNVEFRSLEYPESIKSFRDSMAWMAVPENADRVALAFLYSRVAQHTSEIDDDIRTKVEAIHADIKAEKLDMPELSAQFGRAGHSIIGMFTAIIEGERIKSLRQSWPQIVADHAALRSGSFAQSALSYAAETTPGLRPF